MFVGLCQGGGQFILSGRECDALAVRPLGLYLAVVAGEENHEVGTLCRFHGFSKELLVGRLLRLLTFRAQFTGETLVSRHIGDFGLVAHQRLKPFQRRDFAVGFHSGAHATQCHLGDGILAHDEDALGSLQVDGQQLLVLQQHDGAPCHLKGNGHLLGVARGTAVGFLLGNGRYGEAYTENLPHPLVDDRLAHLAGLH